MNKIVDTTVGELGKGAFNWFLMTFFGEYYLKYLTRQLVLKGVAEAEAEKQLKQFVDNPSPMAAFIQAENEIEYKNMFKTLIKALPKIKKGTPKTDEVDFDVMKRLKDISKDFSSEDMQELVAGILAGEYNQPGTFSLKTLEVVKTLTKNDIVLFQKFCGFVFDGEFFFKNPFNSGSPYLNILYGEGVGYKQLIYLQDLGLVGNRNTTIPMGDNDDSETKYNYKFSIQNKDLIFEKKGYFTIHDISSLTRAGKELLTVTGFIKNDKLVEITKECFKEIFK